eukprot:3490721-Prymnesium_polylepis.1
MQHELVEAILAVRHNAACGHALLQRGDRAVRAEHPRRQVVADGGRSVDHHVIRAACRVTGWGQLGPVQTRRAADGLPAEDAAAARALERLALGRDVQVGVARAERLKASSKQQSGGHV